MNLINRSRVFAIIVLCMFFLSASGQSTIRLKSEFESLFSTGNNLPFWLTHNSEGKYPVDQSSVQLFSLQGYYSKPLVRHTSPGIELGSTVVSTWAHTTDLRLNEGYAKIYLKNWQLDAGLFPEPAMLSGLSSTNGNIDRSNNARPYPRIRLATRNFIPFFLGKKWLKVRVEYDEGMLNDDREVSHTHLHHKSLYFRARIKQKLDITAGMDHYVMWGGNSPVYGKLPSSFKDYLDYITGGKGNSDFPETDQLNVAGNQLGSYYLSFCFDAHGKKILIYANHPFEDHGGMDLGNLPDNLYGLYINLGQRSLIEKLVYEYMYTVYQGGNNPNNGRDDYFNHGYYTTGYTYNGYTMGSPLFSPVVLIKGKRAIENNRIIMHHVGMAGFLSKTMNWNGRFTWTQNRGTYFVPYPKVKNQFSTAIRLNYHTQKLPFNASLTLAADKGQLYKNTFGAMLSISKIW